MRWTHAVAAAVAATGLAGSVAKATLTVSVVPVAISGAATTADPTLNNARSFDLVVNQTSEKWNVSVLQTALVNAGNLSGTFYTPSGHSNIKMTGAPIAGSEHLAYDTAFDTPRWQQTSDVSHIAILGNSDYPNAAGAGATPTVGPSSLSVAWGDQRGDDPGTTAANGSYRVARLTVVGNTGAFLNGYVAGTSGNTAQIFHNIYLPILGDVNLDGLTNQLDLNTVIGSFGGPGNYAQGDLTGDGLINQLDLNQVIGGFGNGIGTPPPGSALGALVPEPTMLGLAVCGVFGMCFRRGRR